MSTLCVMVVSPLLVLVTGQEAGRIPDKLVHPPEVSDKAPVLGVGLRLGGALFQQALKPRVPKRRPPPRPRAAGRGR